MKAGALFSVALLVLLFSCSRADTGFDEVPVPVTEQFGELIIPTYRESFLKEKRYSHFYNLFLSINREQRKAEGKAAVTWYNNSGTALNELKFRLLTNRPGIPSLSVENVSGESGDLPFILSDDNSTLTVDLNGKVVHGRTYRVLIDYHIDFSRPPLYYFDFARIDEEGFSIPHFYPVAARNRRGQWEETPLYDGGDLLSAESAWFFVEIETDDKVKIVSSGREIESQKIRGRQKVSLIAGPVRDFYICGSEDFKERSLSQGEIHIRSYSGNVISGAAAYASEITGTAVELFSREFSPYPFSDIKITALPMSALGIEFPGLFAIKKSLYQDSEGYLFEPTIVHETAHQWFYSLVGTNQLEEPWIDEGLAQYATWLYFKEKYGSMGAQGFYSSFEERWNRVAKENIPINREVSQYKGKEYASIIYGRAPMFFLDVRELMGESSFHSFLREIVETYSLRHISGEIFLDELRRSAGTEVDEIIGEYFG